MANQKTVRDPTLPPSSTFSTSDLTVPRASVLLLLTLLATVRTFDLVLSFVRKTFAKCGLDVFFSDFDGETNVDIVVWGEWLVGTRLTRGPQPPLTNVSSLPWKNRTHKIYWDEYSDEVVRSELSQSLTFVVPLDIRFPLPHTVSLGGRCFSDARGRDIPEYSRT